MTVNIGQTVMKKKGYNFSGIVVADFLTTSGNRRLVVECTVKGAEGLLHIYSPEDLKCYAVLSDLRSDDEEKIVTACREENCPQKVKRGKR